MIKTTELKKDGYLKSNAKYQQMSIYDFIEESQEVEYTQADRRQCLPSETQPQVDEAQDDKAGVYMISDLVPSSALDTDNLISENLVFNPDGYAEKVVELPTEDTDKTCDDCHSKPLFSVGDTVKVVNPYTEDDDPEDYHTLKELEGKEVYILEVNGKSIKGDIISDDLVTYFYSKELQKI